MRPFSAIFVAIFSLLLSGCGYVHFGRLPDRATPLGEAKAAEAYTGLATENKILKQELALARRESDTLKSALERTGAAAATGQAGDIAARLRETTAELAALRTSYADLQNRRAAGQPAAPGRERELEEKLASALREQTQLQAENSRLRTEIDRTRSENLVLAEKLTLATARYEQAETSLGQLNSELVAYKEARSRSEQTAEALRTQLATVMANAGSTSAPAAGLALARASTAEATATAELRLNVDRLRAPIAPPAATATAAAATSASAATAATAASAPPSVAPTPAVPAAPADARAPRKHIVRAGDTLEQLSQRYYGSPSRWRTIYEANAAQLVGGGSLRPGVELTIP